MTAETGANGAPAELGRLRGGGEPGGAARDCYAEKLSLPPFHVIRTNILHSLPRLIERLRH